MTPVSKAFRDNGPPNEGHLVDATRHPTLTAASAAGQDQFVGETLRRVVPHGAVSNCSPEFTSLITM